MGKQFAAQSLPAGGRVGSIVRDVRLDTLQQLLLLGEQSLFRIDKVSD
jgi:hypothetical protein